MASSSAVPPVREYVFIVCRLKLTNDIKSLTPSSLFYHYGETNGIFAVGGLVDSDETPIAAILRYLRELTTFRLANNFPMFPINIIDGYKDHEPIKIRLFVTDVLWDHCRYRYSYNALPMANKLIADKASLYEHLIGGVGLGAVNPDAVPTTVECPNIDDLIIPVYDWEDRDNKSHCIDFGELYTAYQIRSNLGADAGIIPLFHDKHVICDFSDEMAFGQQFWLLLKQIAS
jgi:hypothetical protein